MSQFVVVHTPSFGDCITPLVKTGLSITRYDAFDLLTTNILTIFLIEPKKYPLRPHHDAGSACDLIRNL